MLTHSFTPFLVLAFASLVVSASGLIFCRSALLSLKTEMGRLEKRLESKKPQWEAVIENLQSELTALKLGLRDADERTGLMVPAVAPRSSFNISTRSQALRLSRLGENAENIAAALSIPRREVDLLLKVQRIVIGAADNVTF